ncbi:MAG: LysR family transcriptional regulator [Hyphomicrobiaceae bacterium]|nr:MAG: LysR family transcriptional regulator [Hyphomicrobiaceae bacterium]
MKEKLKHNPMRDVTLKQLRVLAAIARTGRITSAANELGVTPPAVTLQLQLLEESAGVPLFDRTKRGLRPTDAGAYMLGIQARIEAALSECSESLRVMQGLGSGKVSVGVVSTAKYFAPRMLAAFAEAHPQIEVRLVVGNREDTIAALAQLDLDIAVMGRPPESIEVEQQIIGDHPHVVIASPNHRLASRRRIALQALDNEKFLLREAGSGTRTLMERMFAKAEIVPQIGMELGSNETIKQAVMAGLGIAFISAHTVAAEVESGRLCVLPVEGLPIVRQWYAVRNQEKHLLPAGTAMWEFLVSKGSGFLPDVSALIHPQTASPRTR